MRYLSSGPNHHPSFGWGIFAQWTALTTTHSIYAPYWRNQGTGPDDQQVIYRRWAHVNDDLGWLCIHRNLTNSYSYSTFILSTIIRYQDHLHHPFLGWGIMTPSTTLATPHSLFAPYSKNNRSGPDDWQLIHQSWIPVNGHVWSSDCQPFATAFRRWGPLFSVRIFY